MIHIKNKFHLSHKFLWMMVICLSLTPLLAIFQAQAENPENPKWQKWLKMNSHPIEKTRPEVGDYYRDLRFLDQVLKNKRIVFLGESSHGAAEFNSTKVRLVQYLHEKQGYQVLAFESGLGELFAVDAQIDKQAAVQSMKDGLFDIWQTKEGLPLFEYIKKNSTTQNRLQLAGMDMQPVGSYGTFLSNWFQKIDPQMGKLAKRTEERFAESLQQSDIEAFHHDQQKMIGAYQTLYQFTKRHEKKLSQIYPNSPNLLKGTQYVLQDRIHSVTKVMPFYVSYNNYLQAGNKPLANKAFDDYYVARDQAMSKNLVWLTETLYPNQKIIVWAHNLHIRKNNPQTQNPNRRSVNSLDHLLPAKIRQQSYIIGLYMNRGVSALNDRKPLKVQYPHPIGTVESILSKAGYPNLFVDLSRAKKREETSWMYTKRGILDWGGWDEQLVPKDQYDGILFIDQVHMPHYLSEKSTDKIIPYFSDISDPKEK
ncbi:erythromycin esterase family protein [Shimazuella sp. AN120528]|uniref:erythromycin esterase family protein n=1 Tax=Shimazuella soli TaxID=1892854 RepID=UPI001F0F321C|nr:erythromycin esterase family protein [Shimazuella soli]MCH5585651.1 erythromycin esterase family protein [Shimazuella soli]